MKYCHNNKDNIKRMFQLTFSTTKVISIDKLATSVTQQLTKYKIHMTVQLTFSSNKATTIKSTHCTSLILLIINLVTKKCRCIVSKVERED
jgi:hypothetical protein